MSLPLPTLDDRRWDELVEEGRALIPLYAPDWTDHNFSDPGITFTELFAWLAEMQGFQLDRIPARHRLKFLSLVGVAPTPRQPARTVVQFSLADGSDPVALPATVECAQADALGEHVRYRTLEPVRVVATRLERITSVTPAGNRDLTGRWRRGEPLPPFGDDPRPGAALVLELSAPLPPAVPVTIFVSSAGDASGHAERARIEDAAALRKVRCTTPESLLSCEQAEDATPGGDEEPVLLEHDSARTVWELRVGPGSWLRLDPAAGEIVDHTRALTLSGRVEILVPENAAGGERFRLRCRLAGGVYDEPPQLLDLAFNGVEAVQAVPTAEVWPIAPRATIVGVPEPGREVRLGLELDEDDRIQRLDVTDASAPRALLLAYEEPSATEPGSLTVEAAFLGRSDGSPEQKVELANPPVDGRSVRVWTLDAPNSAATRRWRLRPDFDASGPADEHALLDAERGTVVFGDGEHGLVPPKGAAIVVAHDATKAQDGNVRAGAINAISSSAHNRELLTEDVRAALRVTNPIPGVGGMAAETLEHAEGRAAMLVGERSRAVTSADYEEHARATPGVRLARAAARPNTHPGFPCVEAVGVVTVIVLPYLPADRPLPSLGLLRAVSAHLAGHRLVGTRVEVTGPTYTVVTVRACIRAHRLVDRAGLVRRVGESLDRFFHPLRGGPDGTGWPFGRDVVRSEVLQVVDGVAGVDHVLDLELVAPTGVSCGNLCIVPLGLVDSGPHEIEVVAE